MSLTLLPDSSPILRVRVEEFDFANPPVDPVELAQNLYDTMEEHGAYGLAANQCGLPYRVFVLQDDAAGWIACFNPVIEQESDERESDNEGCLSFPRLILKIARPSFITAAYTDANGVFHQRTFEHFQARGFLHETDHLNGVTFTTRASRLVLERARKRLRR